MECYSCAVDDVLRAALTHIDELYIIVCVFGKVYESGVRANHYLPAFGEEFITADNVSVAGHVDIAVNHCLARQNLLLFAGNDAQSVNDLGVHDGI